MSEDKIKAKSDSELFQSWKLLKNGSCAGANAATNPLSELVYSQDKGLSLKCANSGFAHQSNSLFTAIMPQCQGNEENDTDEHKHSMEQNPSAKKCSNVGMDIGKGKKALVIEDALTNLASSSRNPLEKLESTAENDLQTSRVIGNEISNKTQNNEMMLACDKIVPLSHYPCRRRTHMTISEGKEKSLSDRDAKVRFSEEDNDSNSSVESCNSTGSFSTGNKRRKFSQQLIIGSKRVKNQIEENFGSKSYVKRDSSFMNWISNVVNGLPQSIQHVPASDGRLITCNTNQYLEPKNTGFKSIFRSIYCPSSKNSVTRKSHEGEGCKDIEPGYMVHGIEATPITCCEENNSLYKQYLQSNRLEVSADKYEAGPSSQPMIKPLQFFNTIESSNGKEEMRLHSPSTTQNTNNTDNVDTIALYDRMEAGNIHHKTNSTPGSVWLTRFSPKSTAPLIISDHHNEKVGYQVHAAGSSKIPNDSNKHISYLRNCNALFNYHIPSGEHISPKNERSTRLLTSVEDRILSGSCSIDGTDHKEERNLKRTNQAITSKVGCYSSFKKYRSGISEENKFKEDPGTSASKLVERFSQDSHIPQRISDAVKRLRLSRTDIMKWINTHGSLSQLDGFYLRLRLGKWEEGLRGTEYHVASINEGERQSSEQSTTKSVSVNVRGVTYMLEIRYISNHDFLEEEIMEWWFTTTEAGAAIPSEQDLNKRIQKKIVLGL